MLHQTSATRVLGIDYGTRRVGVAINHGSLAEPLEIVANHDRPDQALSRLVSIIKENQITQLVVGLSEGQMADLTQAFIDKLRLRLNEAQQEVRIEYIDETLSSAEMLKKIRLGGFKRSKRQQPIDHLVAAQLLQDWLDGQPGL